MKKMSRKQRPKEDEKSAVPGPAHPQNVETEATPSSAAVAGSSSGKQDEIANDDDKDIGGATKKNGTTRAKRWTKKGRNVAASLSSSSSSNAVSAGGKLELEGEETKGEKLKGGEPLLSSILLRHPAASSAGEGGAASGDADAISAGVTAVESMDESAAAAASILANASSVSKKIQQKRGAAAINTTTAATNATTTAITATTAANVSDSTSDSSDSDADTGKTGEKTGVAARAAAATTVGGVKRSRGVPIKNRNDDGGKTGSARGGGGVRRRKAPSAPPAGAASTSSAAAVDMDVDVSGVVADEKDREKGREEEVEGEEEITNGGRKGKSSSTPKGRNPMLLWNPSMDKKLLEGHELYGHIRTGKWKSIAEHVGNGVDNDQCSLRWFNYVRPETARSSKIAADWTSVEDEKLRNIVEPAKAYIADSIGTENECKLPDESLNLCVRMSRGALTLDWVAISARMDGISARSCSVRWNDNLRAVKMNKGAFQPEEDEIILATKRQWNVEKRNKWGLWVALEKELGRPSKAIANRWVQTLSKRVPEGDLAADQPGDDDDVDGGGGGGGDGGDSSKEHYQADGMKVEGVDGEMNGVVGEDGQVVRRRRKRKRVRVSKKKPDHLRIRKAQSYWTPELDERLREAFEMFGEQGSGRWMRIAEHVGRGFSNARCCQRWRYLGNSGNGRGSADEDEEESDFSGDEDSGVRKRRKRKCVRVNKKWTPELDERLREAFEMFGEQGSGRWMRIAEHVGGGFSNARCCQRWRYLGNSGNGRGPADEDEEESDFSEDEDSGVLEWLHPSAVLSNSWSGAGVAAAEVFAGE